MRYVKYSLDTQVHEGNGIFVLGNVWSPNAVCISNWAAITGPELIDIYRCLGCRHIDPAAQSAAAADCACPVKQ